jgi:D-alanyl-D-alanine carboxypeptidase
MALLLGGALSFHPGAASASGNTQVDAPSPTFDPEIEAALERLIDDHLASTGAPGALVGIWSPDSTFVRATGLADVETGRTLDPLDRFRIGSITKTFVATLILQLIDEGRLGLDDTLERFVPGVSDGDRITIRQLLGMTSGVANVLKEPAFLQAYAADPLLPLSPQTVLAISRGQAPAFTPGAGFHYSETNYLLLGLVAEQITGLPIEEAIDRWLVQPLRLSGTSLPTTPDLAEPFSHGYQPIVGTAAVGPDVTRSNPAITWTAGGMVANLQDLHVWTRSLATGALLSPDLQRERIQWTAVPGGESLDAAYGLGILRMAGFVGHNGGLPGYSSIAMHLLEDDTTIVILVNQSTLDGGPADRLFYAIAGLLFPDRFLKPHSTA